VVHHYNYYVFKGSTEIKLQHHASTFGSESLLGTKARDKALKVARDEGLVVITGRLGSGKSHLALDVLANLSDVENDVIPLAMHALSDIRLLETTSLHVVVLLDDVFGYPTLDKAVVNEMIYLMPVLLEFVEQKRITLILTVEDVALKTLRTSKFEELHAVLTNTKHLVDLDSANVKLNETDRKRLLQFYQHDISVQDMDATLQNIDQSSKVSTDIGFPITCALMVVLGRDASVLQHPVNALIEHMKAYRDDDFPCFTLLVLVLVMDER